MPSCTLSLTEAPAAIVTLLVRLVPLTVKLSPLNRGNIVVSAYRAETVPVSSLPDAVVAIGELAVIVRVVDEPLVLVSVRYVTATLLYVTNLRSRTVSP